MATMEYQNLIQRLKILFPNLEPITNTPPLLLLRGIGLAMVGRRDVHLIGVGAVVRRPSLRTVQVVLPHTALRHSVSRGEKAGRTGRTSKVIQMGGQRDKAVVRKI